ncbi:MAG: ankyrin repeat domain-containing protein [Gammaproteobacteria bacterium]|nr:ankyrin repeat domain-containing protein [Gammaproteobacteria bacterium]
MPDITTELITIIKKNSAEEDTKKAIDAAIDEVRKADPSQTKVYVNTLLHFSVQTGHLPIVQYLLDEKGGDPHATNTIGQNILHLAAINGHLSIVRYLVNQQKLNPHTARVHGGETPLHCAALAGYLPVVRYLVDEEKVDLYAKNNVHSTAAHQAALMGHVQVLRYLIDEKYMDPNTTDSLGSTILHTAARNRRLLVVQYLVCQTTININTKDRDKKTAFISAQEKKHLKIMSYLFKHGADVPFDYTNFSLEKERLFSFVFPRNLLAHDAIDQKEMDNFLTFFRTWKEAEGETLRLLSDAQKINLFKENCNIIKKQRTSDKEKFILFAMGRHKHTGASSSVKCLPDDILYMIGCFMKDSDTAKIKDTGLLEKSILHRKILGKINLDKDFHTIVPPSQGIATTSVQQGTSERIKL